MVVKTRGKRSFTRFFLVKTRAKGALQGSLVKSRGKGALHGLSLWRHEVKELCKDFPWKTDPTLPVCKGNPCWESDLQVLLCKGTANKEKPCKEAQEQERGCGIRDAGTKDCFVKVLYKAFSCKDRKHRWFTRDTFASNGSPPEPPRVDLTNWCQGVVGFIGFLLDIWAAHTLSMLRSFIIWARPSKFLRFSIEFTRTSIQKQLQKQLVETLQFSTTKLLNPQVLEFSYKLVKVSSNLSIIPTVFTQPLAPPSPTPKGSSDWRTTTAAGRRQAWAQARRDGRGQGGSSLFLARK